VHRLRHQTEEAGDSGWWAAI